MKIDCDTTYWPIDVLETVDHPAKGRIERDDETTASYYRDGELVQRFRSTRWDLARRKQAMDEEGFDAQVLIPDNRVFLYDLEHALGSAMAAAYNDRVAAAAADLRFIGAGWLYLPDMPEALAELERAATELGLRAVTINGGFADGDLDGEELWPLYEAAEALNVALLVRPLARAFEDQTGHPWLIGADRYAGMRFLAPALGFPFTYMNNIARLICGGVLDRFAKLRFGFLGAGAGWVPFLRDRLDREAAHRSFRSYLTKRGLKLARRPSEYFDNLYMAAFADEPVLAETARLWPDHRLIVGSGFDQAEPTATWPTTVARLAAAPGLAEADRAAILGDNPRRLFALD